MAERCTNLGPRGRLIRWVEGGSAFGTATALVTMWPASPAMRTLAVVLMMLGVFCWLQARASTCAVLALAGQRDLDSGRERVTDRHERQTLRRSAAWIVAQSVAAGATGLAIAIAI